MNEKLAVHVGGGALGRGLVIPLLMESGWDMVLVDTDHALLDHLASHGNTYVLDETDAAERLHTISLADALSPVDDRRRLMKILRSCSVVTTSVRKENLLYVAPLISEAWGRYQGDKMILCCENVEHVGSYFKNLLITQSGLSAQDRENLADVIVPDTAVDRICSVGPAYQVVSEAFHECAVDAAVLPTTGIDKIISVDHIEAHFYRKRYLLNTYADLCAFLGRERGFRYLYEAVRDDEINERVRIYIDFLVDELHVRYGIERAELEKWRKIYRSRLSNKLIPRELETVARDLWRKLALSERFIAPVIGAMKDGRAVDDVIPVLKRLIGCADVERSKTLELVQDLWSSTPSGQRLYQVLIERAR